MLGVRVGGSKGGYRWDFTNKGTIGGAASGNLGNLLNGGWMAVDPGSGGSHGVKFMFENVDESGYALYAMSLRCRAKAASAICVGLNVSASASIAASGQLLGGEFYLQNSGSYTVTGTYQSAALHVKSWLQAAVTPSASALWIDDESTLGVGTIRMIDMTMNGSVVIESAIRIYGGDPGATYLFDFQTCDQGAGAFLAASTSAWSGLTAVAKMKCRFGTTTGYLYLASA